MEGIINVLKTKFLNLSKISFNKRYLLHIYLLAIPLLLPHKKEQTDPGTSLDRVDSDLDSKAGNDYR